MSTRRLLIAAFGIGCALITGRAGTGGGSARHERGGRICGIHPSLASEQRESYGVNLDSVDAASFRRVVQATADAGIRWARDGISREVVHLGPGRYNWTDPDVSIADATARNIQVLVVLGYTPSWDTTAPDPTSYYARFYPPRSYEQWGDYVFQTVNRYKNRVHYWEVWNEPDGPPPDIGYWAGTPAEYARLLAVAYDQIKRTDPTAQVLIGGLLGESFSEEFYQEILNDPTYPAGSNFDILSLHPYGTRQEVWDKVGHWASIAERPLWATEMGWPGDPALQDVDPEYCCGEEKKARYLEDVMPSILDLGAEKVFWYGMWVFVRRPEDLHFESFGLLDSEFRHHPAYFSFKDLLAGLTN